MIILILTLQVNNDTCTMYFPIKFTHVDLVKQSISDIKFAQEALNKKSLSDIVNTEETILGWKVKESILGFVRMFNIDTKKDIDIVSIKVGEINETLDLW